MLARTTIKRSDIRLAALRDHAPGFLVNNGASSAKLLYADILPLSQRPQIVDCERGETLLAWRISTVSGFHYFLAPSIIVSSPGVNFSGVAELRCAYNAHMSNTKLRFRAAASVTIASLQPERHVVGNVAKGTLAVPLRKHQLYMLLF